MANHINELGKSTPAKSKVAKRMGEQRLNAWGQTPQTAKTVRKQLRQEKKNRRMQKMFSKRGYGLP